MRKLIIWIGLLTVLLLGLLTLSNPQSVASALLVLPLLLIYVILTLICALPFVGHLSTAKSIRRGALIAILPSFLLVLQSIGQLTVRDVSAVFILLLIGGFYFSRSAIRR